jgi:uncharacterized protein (TIGR01319 family)
MAKEESQLSIDPKKVKTILATDCGSTTTKAILIEELDGEYRLSKRGEAPTTVEAPFEDVTMGVRNAITEIMELKNQDMEDASKHVNYLDEGGVITTSRYPDREETRGVDLYVSTSSAGGGLQMMVSGVVKSMTAESAERAALGAGAIVMDVIAQNDGREDYVKIQRIRELRPDMILLSGGIDGGTTVHVAELAEMIAAAAPKPRLGIGYRLPIIFAGNKDARPLVERILGEQTDLRIVDNLRPVLERENLGPARDEIHNLFMEHVMAQAPGYNKLMDWADAPIMPTPGAVGKLIEETAREQDITIVGVDIGGATTDVFSVFADTFNRTVSANLGMSYSICNVLNETGVENILRWVPLQIEIFELRNRIRNKMIRPTTIPQSLQDLVIEQAIAREALRLAFEHHKTLAVGLKGVQQVRDVAETFSQSGSGATLVDLMELDMIIGSGGVLSHAPRRVQSVMMMLDAFQPEGVTKLTVDSIFMMPQLGVLSEVHPKAATQVFDRDCLIRLGTAVSPVQATNSKVKPGDPCVTVNMVRDDGTTDSVEVPFGSIAKMELKVGHTATLEISPRRGFDVGAGSGHKVEVEAEGGLEGIVVDARGRNPMYLPTDQTERVEKLMEWIEAMETYPIETLKAYLE